MSDKEIEELTEDMLKETDSDEFSEIEDLSDFVDLEDLESLMAEDDFVDLEGLGDLTDLGDLSDMNDLSDLEDIPDPDVVPDGEAALADTVAEPEALDVLSDMEASTDAALLSSEDEAESFGAMPELSVDGAESSLGESEFHTVEPEPVLEEPEFSVTEPEPVLTEPELALEESDLPLPEPEAEVSLDAMVDGFLDDLDATGSQTASQTVADMPEDEGDLDQLLDMLGEPEGLSAVEEKPEEPKPDEDIFGLDEMLALDEEQPEEGLSPDEDMAALLDDLAGTESVGESVSQPEEKEPGLLKKLFGNIVTDEIAEAELAQRAADQEAALVKEEEAAKAREEKEAAKAAKAEEKAAAKQAKTEEKALKKAAKAEEKAAKKAEREARKAEEAAQAELEVTGKLNKVGVSIIVILTVMFLTVEITGTNVFSYKSTLKNAENYFNMKKYTQAYQEILGTDLKEKDRETYDKIVTVMKVQRSINSYENYANMKYYPDALNALLVGLKKYDENIETARNLEVDQDMDACRAEIISILQSEFGVSETEAYDILSMEKEAYTDKVVEIGMDQQ